MSMFSQVVTDTSTRLPRALLAATCLAGMLGAAPAIAQDGFGNRSFYGLDPIANEELADLRGGFAVPSGLLYFTIDLYAAIDGNAVYDIGLAFDGTTIIATDPIINDGSVTIGDSGAIIATIQNGADGTNIVNNSAFADVMGVVNVIQNAENGVTIQQLTDITVGLEATNFDPAALSGVVDQLQALTMLNLP